MRFAGFGWSGASEIVIRKHFFFPLRWLPPHPSPDMIFFQHDRPWPVSVFPLMEHDAHKRMLFFLVELLHVSLIDLFAK